MKQDRRGSGSDRRRSAAAPDGAASRGSAGHADGSLGAEKKSYRQFNVGDRLESRDAENPRPSTVTAADYADFINSFGVPKKRSSGSSLSKRGVSRGKTKGHPRGRKSGDGTPVPGSQIKDIIRRQLPRLRVRLTASAIVSLLTGILIYHVFMGFYVEYKTEVVSISPYLETIDVKGYAILDEKVVSGTMSSTSVMTIQNGDKVSAGDPIVNIFSSESEARAYERVSEIDRELEVLMSMDNTSEDSASKVDLLSKQLDRNMSELNKAVENRNMTEVAKIKNDISYLLNKRLVAMRQDKDFNSKIESLQKEREELESQYSKQPDTINASDSGYFTDSCDGYECALSSRSTTLRSSFAFSRASALGTPAISSGKSMLPSASLCISRLNCWNIMEILRLLRLRSLFPRPVSDSPSKSTFPSVGCSSRLIVLTSVDLPAPERPMMP